MPPVPMSSSSMYLPNERGRLSAAFVINRASLRDERVGDREGLAADAVVVGRGGLGARADLLALLGALPSLLAGQVRELLALVCASGESRELHEEERTEDD